MNQTHEKVSAAALHDRMRRSGKAYLLDVRSPAEYAGGHVAGAVSIPLDELDSARARSQLGDDAGGSEPLHLICASGLRAEQAAHKLRKQGLSNLVVVEGGTEAWVRQRLPMQRPGGVVPLDRQAQIAVGLLILMLLAKGALLHPLFYALTGLLGIGLVVSGLTARCGLSSVLARMPWNRSPLGVRSPST